MTIDVHFAIEIEITGSTQDLLSHDEIKYIINDILHTEFDTEDKVSCTRVTFTEVKINETDN